MVFAIRIRRHAIARMFDSIVQRASDPWFSRSCLIGCCGHRELCLRADRTVVKVTGKGAKAIAISG